MKTANQSRQPTPGESSRGALDVIGLAWLRSLFDSTYSQKSVINTKQ
jgi:hypothetical protein